MSTLNYKEMSFDEINLNDDNFITYYLNEISKFPLLTFEEEKELMKKIKKGDIDAKKRFAECNLKLVINVAKKYLGKGMSFFDLIEEGNVGLMMAIELFDASYNNRFSTYATHWIKYTIIKALVGKTRNIAIPYYMSQKIKKYRQCFVYLSKKLNREPTILEVANELNISLEKATKLYFLLDDTVSLNEIILEDSDFELQTCFAFNEMIPEDILFKKELSLEIKELLEKINFTKREKEVLMLRYDFINDEYMSLQEVGNILGITRERARQIENQILNKIRNSGKVFNLISYMPDDVMASNILKDFKISYSNKVKIKK